jgi:hypothetical protein
MDEGGSRYCFITSAFSIKLVGATSKNVLKMGSDENKKKISRTRKQRGGEKSSWEVEQ